jgi:hypothetical protein
MRDIVAALSRIPYRSLSLPHIVFIATLQNNLMEGLLLFAKADFFIAIINQTVFKFIYTHAS